MIVSTCIGAADARLLAACGIVLDDDDVNNEESGRLKSIKGNINEKTKVGVKFSKDTNQQRKVAPDNLPPLSMPFVIIDEACQSVEPASLIPIMSTDIIVQKSRQKTKNETYNGIPFHSVSYKDLFIPYWT